MATVNADKTSFPGGFVIRSVTAASGVSDPPTAAELTTKLGTPSVLGSGYLVKLIDSGNSKQYLATTNGTGWNYVVLTAAA